MYLKIESILKTNPTEEEFLQITGIGESTAKKIIEYRNKIPFHCKEDLLKINGIGEKKYEMLKELISV